MTVVQSVDLMAALSVCGSVDLWVDWKVGLWADLTVVMSVDRWADWMASPRVALLAAMMVAQRVDDSVVL